MSTDRQRRIFILGMGALGVAPLLPTPALAADRRPTPRMTEGPFYPRTFPDDVDGDLTRMGQRPAASGVPLEMSGVVMDVSGAPRANARVEIWQCDAFGAYHHVGEPEGSGDPNFQGYGAVTTDAQGRYRFRTIRPVPYPGRTPHIHFTVLENNRRRLTSQMFIEGDPGNARDGLYRHLGADAARVTMKVEQQGAALRGALDIVLG